MTLREQIMKELKESDSITKEEIRKCDESIDGERFIMSTINGGPLAGAARSACQRRLEASRVKKEKLQRANEWTREMLAKYK